MAVGSQRVLDNAERYGLYVAMALNDLGDEVVFSRKNLGRCVGMQNCSNYLLFLNGVRILQFMCSACTIWHHCADIL